MDVGGWLRTLGLERYEPVFRENNIDDDILPKLTAEDLKDLGVALVGDRRRLLEAIALLGAAELEPPKAPTGGISARSAPNPESLLPLDSASGAKRAHPVGERRHVTAMFCDLVDSTGISARLDAEEWRDLVGAYLDAASAAVTEMGGHVAKKLGDGLMALFGYPVAHENDAERAARAALAIQRGLAELNRKNEGTGKPVLTARVGLETGVAVVDAAGEIYGDVANIAARVQALAETGAVLVTARVQRQVAGLFVAEERGTHTLKGVPEPTALFRLVRPSGGGRRSAQRNLTPLVGRDDEITMLLRRWERARQGDGQFVVIVGEPGLGKSRLIEEFRSRLGDTPHTWVEWSCSQLLQNTPLHSIAEWGRQRFGGPDVPADRRLADLESSLAQVKLNPEEDGPFLAPLLDIPLPAGRMPTLPPDEVRRRQLATLTNWVIASAKVQPVALAFEDLHWADPTTLDVLRGVAESGALAPLFVLATARPEFKPAWPHRSHHTVITLAPLDRREIAEMVREMAARHPVSSRIVEIVVARTGGVPLFVEEVTRLLLDNSDQAETYAIPSTLQALLAARLDRLGLTKEVAQFASVFGREFSYQLIRAVTGQSDATLIKNLERLADADFIHVDGAAPDSNYRFKHALLQDAAYESMLKSQRRKLHGVIAQILSENFRQIADAHPELLAHHFTQAGSTEQAISFWLLAGQKAVERSANVEALSHFSNGLELVELLPEGAKRDQLELDLRAAAGVPLIASRGYTAPEVEKTYSRARELSEKLGGSPQFANIVWGLWVRYLGRNSLGAALEMAEQYCAIAERTQNDGHLLETCQVMGLVLFYLADFARALAYLARGSAAYVPERHHALIYEHGGADTGVSIRVHQGLALWVMGYPDQARKCVEQGLQTARSLARHPFSLAFALYFYAWFFKLCGDKAAVVEAADAAIQICDEHSFPFWGLASATLRGSAIAELGSQGEGVHTMREALSSYEGIGGGLFRPELIGLLSVGLASTGQINEALRAIAEAHQAVEQSQERWYQAELYRLNGELTSMLPGNHAAAAEIAFVEALRIARQQEAKSWELRAAMSVARLWRDQGKPQQARELLAPVYGWFTEGFDTLDLKEAKALLDELHA